jgi:hypothetical protein
VFDELHTHPSPRIISLGWRDNPISLKGHDFLDSCRDLRELDLSGCVAPQSRILGAVADFLANSTLDKFKMVGTHRNKLTGSDLIKIIRALRTNAALSVLNVVKNECDPATLPEVAEVLLANLTLEKLTFTPPDGANLAAFWRGRRQARGADRHRRHGRTDGRSVAAQSERGRAHAAAPHRRRGSPSARRSRTSTTFGAFCSLNCPRSTIARSSSGKCRNTQSQHSIHTSNTGAQKRSWE